MSVTISHITIGPGPMDGRCGHCRRLRPIWFLDYVRVYGSDSAQGVHTASCEQCIVELRRENIPVIHGDQVTEQVR